MPIPQAARVDAISASITDDPISHRLGRDDPDPPAFTVRIGGRLIAEHDGDEGQRSEGFNSETHAVFGDGERGMYKKSIPRPP